jgi:hypothetical protein
MCLYYGDGTVDPAASEPPNTIPLHAVSLVTDVPPAVKAPSKVAVPIAGLLAALPGVTQVASDPMHRDQALTPPPGIL